MKAGSMSRVVSLDEVGSSNLEADSRCAVYLQTLAEKLMQVEDALYQIELYSDAKRR